MLIDWFTVGAQALNFLVLVWLLKRYLYHPVLAAIDAREKQIAAALADAASQRTVAEQERSAWADKNSSLERERDGLLEAARRAADAERDRLFAEARAESAALRAKQITAGQDDQKRIEQEIARLARTEVLAIARKVLGDLAEASLEERVVDVFVHRLRDLDAARKKTLQEAVQAVTEVTVTSTFVLSDGQRSIVRSTLDRALSRSTVLRFAISSDLLCGIRISAGGEQIAWDIADYLNALDEKLDALLSARYAASGSSPAAPAPRAVPMR